MAQWEQAVVTDLGLALLSRCLAGEQLYLDYAMGGVGTVPVGQLRQQTSLYNQKQEIPIINQKAVFNGRQVAGLITNLELENSYQMTQYGVYAHIGKENPVLMAILQDSEGLYIPSRTDIPEFHFVFYNIIDLINEAVWHYTIDPSLMKPRMEMTDPTQDAPGALSQFWVNADTGSLFVCVDTGGGLRYTWMQIVTGSVASGAAILGAAFFGAAHLMSPQ